MLHLNNFNPAGFGPANATFANGIGMNNKEVNFAGMNTGRLQAENNGVIARKTNGVIAGLNVAKGDTGNGVHLRRLPVNTNANTQAGNGKIRKHNVIIPVAVFLSTNALNTAGMKNNFVH